MFAQFGLLLVAFAASCSGESRREWADHLRESLEARLSGEVLLPPTTDTVVRLKLRLQRVLLEDEASGEVEVLLLAAMSWYDPDLRWEFAHFGNLTKIPFPGGRMWTPRLVFRIHRYVLLHSLAQSSNVLLHHDGNCLVHRLLRLRIPAFKGLWQPLQVAVKDPENSDVRLISSDLPFRPSVAGAVELTGLLHPARGHEYRPHPSLIYRLSLRRIADEGGYLLGVRCVGLCLSLVLAWLFPLEPARPQRRVLGLSVATSVSLLVALLCLCLRRRLEWAERAWLACVELLLLSAWLLCILESLLISALIACCPRASAPLSRTAAHVFWPLLRAATPRCERAEREEAAKGRLRRPPSELSTIAAFSVSSTSQRRGCDSGLSSATPSEHRLLNDSIASESLLRQSPDASPPLSFHASATLPHRIPDTFRLQRPEIPHPLKRNFSALSTLQQSPQAALSSVVQTECGSSASSRSRRAYTRRHLLLALDRIFPLVLAPAALLLICLSA